MARRNLSFAAVRLGAAALLLAACVSEVRLAPDDHGWQTSASDATWRSDPVLVVARLDTDAGVLPARGMIVNTGTEPVHVTFVPDVPSPAHADGLPDAAIGGVPFEVPGSFDLERGTFEFALRPDERWSGLPPAGAPISWTIVVTTASGEARCPFRFRVVSAGHAVSKEAEAGIVTVLLSAAFLATGYYIFW